MFWETPTVQTVPYFRSFTVYQSERHKDSSVSPPAQILSFRIFHTTLTLVVFAGPRQVRTPSCHLSANFQLCGLVSCVLHLRWAADLTELVASATVSAKGPPPPLSLCFPRRYFDNLRVCRRRTWGECGVAATCLLKHRSSLK